MKIRSFGLMALTPLALLAACAATPMGPTVQVMPGPTIPFQIFQQDQVDCKQYAQSQVEGQADAANKAAVGSALLGTALGAALGTAVGNGQGAAVGGATGAVAGTGIGAATSQNAQTSIQTQYDNAYVQCMYAKGNQVPGAPAPQASVAPPPSATPVAAMTIADAQERLNALGFPAGPADGSMGSHTRQALKHFQQSRGLPQTGELDAATVAALSN